MKRTAFRSRVTIDDTWPAAREVALQRDGYRCAVCGAATREVNHRLPRQQGGRMRDPLRHCPSRLITLCRTHHHIAETVDRAAAYTNGLFVRGRQDPATVPVRYRDGWHLLTSDGLRVPCAEPLAA